jgi:hypothetical protein
MEYWSNGVVEYWIKEKKIIPEKKFQYSIAPILQHSN